LQSEIEIILMNLDPSDHTFKTPNVEDNSKTNNMLPYIFLPLVISMEGAKPDLENLLTEFQKREGLRITGKFDKATCSFVSNTIVT
jgi:hypothetical protein